ncbi:MFS transporter [Lentzea sp. BCCO 10_0798]|uniref:MFS transporter n=1 Tax=Lentzea kristufekii TaxID=3095430 RepID=A0ABU4U7B4_9PSEU|nr:MFS transporter [Lentzea sp. BCCO 10_0798]MDX8056480.1 MFS transporter [Lentzea sp. BCCO 10_0798]
MESTDPAENTTRAGRREWIGLAVLALPTLLLSLDLSVLFLAQPQLSADLNPSATEQLWIMDIYAFMIAGFLVTMGTLGDRIGRRKLMLFGSAAFAVASVLAAYSTTPEMLIAARALLGIAGATLMPSTLALIMTMFTDAKQRGFAIGVWLSSFMGGMAIGPVIGGVLLGWFWWGSVFLMAVPVMVLLLITAPVLLPEMRDPDAGRIDLLSVVLSLFAILPVVYGLKEIAQHGFGAFAGGSILAGIVFGVLFVLRQRTLDSPLLDLKLFRSRTLSGALVIMLLTSATISSSIMLFSLYLQTVRGYSAVESGLWLIPAATALIVTSLVAPKFAQKIRPAYVAAAGLLVAAVGLAIVSQAGPATSLLVVLLGFVLVQAGVGPMGSLGTEMVVGSAPEERAGSAASVSETSTELGVAIGVATYGTIAAAVYQNVVAVPPGVPAEAAAAARETISGAVAAAEGLATDTGAALLDSARAAFTSGVNTAAGVAAVILVVLSGLTVALLRHVGKTGEEPPAPADAGVPVAAEREVR